MTGSDTEVAPEPVRPGRLSDMVQAAQRAGASYAEMARRSVGADGKGMSKPYFQRLATGGVSKAPSGEELEAIARGIGKPARLVKQAAASQWFGLEVQELSGYDDDVRHIVVRVADMEPQERKKWRAMIEAANDVE